MTPEDRDIRLKALTRLAIATREKVEPQTYAVYLDDTRYISTGVLVTACKRLETQMQWFPKVSELREACQAVARYQADNKRKLPEHKPELSDDKWDEIKRKLRETLARKVMP